MNAPRWKAAFFAIWTGQAFSLVGSALVQFALIWWLTETAGSAKTLALATSASLVPTILLGLFVAPDMQGRFFTLNQSILSAMGPLALVAAAPRADRFGVRPFWFACAAGGLVIVLIRRFVPAIYYLEDQPDVAHSAGE